MKAGHSVPSARHDQGRTTLTRVSLTVILPVLYFFLPPYYALQIQDLNTALRFCFFLGVNGLIVGLIANLYRTQAALARSDRIFRNFAELIPFGGWISDGDHNMIHLSESFRNTFGLGPEEGLGIGWTAPIVPE